MPGQVTGPFISGDKIYFALDNANEDISMFIVSMAEQSLFSSFHTQHN